ncbi:MAG: hypothetical protein M1269_08895 [Chloroflexi bacterium]|nr:hypothetical protein [Chloroflexota bacterium]
MDQIINAFKSAGVAITPAQLLAYGTQAEDQEQETTGGSTVSVGQLNASDALNYTWSGLTGGIAGLSSINGTSSGSVSFSIQNYNYIGTNAMSAVGEAEAANTQEIDNTIEVAGTGMGSDKKYKMYAGELLAVYSVVKDGANRTPEDMQTALKDRYGIETEIKEIDGRKALVNTKTGNVMIADGNGNNLLDKDDLQFQAALDVVKERYNIDVEQFEQDYDITKGGIGSQSGANVFMSQHSFYDDDWLENLDVGDTKWRKHKKYDPDEQEALDAAGEVATGQNVDTMGWKYYGDPIWQNSVREIFSKVAYYNNILN